MWIRDHYPDPRFSLEECLARHKEYAVPVMLDNMNGLVYAEMELNMKTSKKVNQQLVLQSIYSMTHVRMTIIKGQGSRSNLKKKMGKEDRCR